MSLAYRCDHCRKYFDLREFTKNTEYCVITEYCSVRINYTCADRVEKIHFCPKCNNLFRQFILRNTTTEEEIVHGS